MRRTGYSKCADRQRYSQGPPSRVLSVRPRPRLSRLRSPSHVRRSFGLRGHVNRWTGRQSAAYPQTRLQTCKWSEWPLTKTGPSCHFPSEPATFDSALSSPAHLRRDGSVLNFAASIRFLEVSFLRAENPGGIGPYERGNENRNFGKADLTAPVHSCMIMTLPWPPLTVAVPD